MMFLLKLFAFLLLLQGCAPYHFSGYMPTGAGYLDNDRCSTIQDIFKIPADAGVEITVAVPKGGTAMDLAVRMFVPDGTVLTLGSEELGLQSPEWPQPRALRVQKIGQYPWSRGDLSPTSELRGKRHVVHTLWGTDAIENGTWFWMKFERESSQDAAASRVRSFTLHVPELRINGNPYPMKPIVFEAYSKWGLAGFCK